MWIRAIVRGTKKEISIDMEIEGERMRGRWMIETLRDMEGDEEKEKEGEKEKERDG